VVRHIYMSLGFERLNHPRDISVTLMYVFGFTLISISDTWVCQKKLLA